MILLAGFKTKTKNSGIEIQVNKEEINCVEPGQDVECKVYDQMPKRKLDSELEEGSSGFGSSWALREMGLLILPFFFWASLLHIVGFSGSKATDGGARLQTAIFLEQRSSILAQKHTKSGSGESKIVGDNPIPR